MATAQQPLSPEVYHLTRKPIDTDIELMDSSPMNLLTVALRNNAAIDVIERLAALQRDERNYHAQVAFDEALNRCQAKLTRISADAKNGSTNSRYATYAKIDATVRPIYTAEGFSISFGERDCPTPDKTRFVAFVRRAGVTVEYLKDISPSTKGPKGNDVMTPIHADASADSYAKRYLLKNIFNIAIGDDDTDGNPPPTFPAPGSRLKNACDKMRAAANVDACWMVFKEEYKAARAAGDKGAMTTLLDVMNARKAAGK